MPWDTEVDSLKARDPCGQVSDMSMCSLVDDAFKKLLVMNSVEVAIEHGNSNTDFDVFIQPSRQKLDEQKVLLHLVGAGPSQSSMDTYHGHVTRVERHLGRLIESDLARGSESRQRSYAVRVGWRSMGRFLALCHSIQLAQVGFPEPGVFTSVLWLGASRLPA